MTTPLKIIENSETFPERTKATWDMLVAAKAQDVGDMKWSLVLRADAFAFDGKVYVFLPNLVVVYDYHEWVSWMSAARPDNTEDLHREA